MAITWQTVYVSARSFVSILGFGVLPAPAQSAIELPAVGFSVVSVKANSPDAQLDFRWTDNGFVERGNPLRWLVQLAYNIPDSEWILKAPGWVDSQRFDITAKVDDKDLAAYKAMKPEEKAILLQAVLKDRFELKVHDETRIFPQYGLHIAKAGLNPNLHATTVDEEQAWKVTPGYHLSARKVKILELCHGLLSTEAQAQVVDQTGLTGKV